MNELVLQIQENMEVGQATPHELAHWRMQITGVIARYTDQLQEIQLKKPAIWNELRKSHKYVADTDREWEATEMGLQEKWLETEIKKLDKISSSLRTALEAANIASRGM